MKNLYNQKLFEFTNVFIDNPVEFGFVKLFQMGETCLERSAAIGEHIQPCTEISFVVSGKGVFTTDQTEYKLGVGDIHVIPKDCMHSIRADDGSDLRFVHLAFALNGKTEEKGLSDVAEFYKTSPDTILRDNGELRMLFTMLIDEFYLRPMHSEIMIEAIIKQILVYVWRLYTADKKVRFLPIKKKDTMGGTVYSIIRYIDSNITEIMSVKSIADKFSYSGNYLSHLIKNKTGMSLQQYIQNERIQYAKKLLSDKKSTVTEVSRILNYDSPQAFSKMFKKMTGMLPSEYKGTTQD